MSTESGSECTISGDFNTCPAGSDFEYAGVKQTLEAFLQCPLDSVAQSGFISASQRGLCECDATLLDGAGAVLQDMECDCFACPDGSRFGFAYSCTTPIAGPCLTFDCFGNCNDPGFNPLNLDRATFGPTEAPLETATDSYGSAATNLGSSSTVVGMAVMVAALFRAVM
jgi:hypothetical protein